MKLIEIRKQYTNVSHTSTLRPIRCLDSDYGHEKVELFIDFNKIEGVLLDKSRGFNSSEDVESLQFICT